MTAKKEKTVKTSGAIQVTAESAGIDNAGYQRLIDLSPMPIAVHIKGVLVYANQATANVMAAKNPDQLIGRNVLDFVHPDSQQLVITRMAEIYNKGKQSTNIVEEKFIREDGEVINVEIASMLFHYEGQTAIQLILRDITEQQRAKAALIESEERFRQLADSMPQMVWTSNPDGTVTYRNQKWFEFTDFDKDDLKTDWYSFIHEDDRERVLEPWQESLATGKPFQAEFRLRDKKHSHRYHWFLSRSIPAKDAEGNITQWYGTSTDITDVRRTTQRKKELERVTTALTEQRTQLVALNQAKDEFISLASHQLRTPATGVKQYIGMVLEGYAGELTPELKTFLERAYESNERQITIINDLLKVAQIDAGKVILSKTKTDMVKLVQDVINEQSSRFQSRNQSVTFSKKHTPLIALVDMPRFRMALDNVIDNASKYTPAGKSIEITVSKIKETIAITIKDEGVGIKPEDIDKIFLKFSRLDNPLSAHAGGSGLGLYWVQKIVDLHDGTISVHSETDKGSTFTIALPA